MVNLFLFFFYLSLFYFSILILLQPFCVRTAKRWTWFYFHSQLLFPYFRIVVFFQDLAKSKKSNIIHNSCKSQRHDRSMTCHSHRGHMIIEGDRTYQKILVITLGQAVAIMYRPWSRVYKINQVVMKIPSSSLVFLNT